MIQHDMHLIVDDI